MFRSPIRDECFEADEEELQGMVMLPLCGAPRRLQFGEKAIGLLDTTETPITDESLVGASTAGGEPPTFTELSDDDDSVI